MKKDIDWLNNELEKIIKDVESDDISFAGKDDYDEGYIDGVRDVQPIVNQLDEPETLTQKWIDKNMVHVRGLGDVIEAGAVENLLVPKTVSKKPTIPEFVAEFLDGKEDYALYELLDNDSIYDSHDRSAKWLYDNDEETNRERELSLVLAHMYGYEVETERKYYVMNNDDRMMLVRMMDGKTITEADPFKLEDMYEGEKESHRLTEQEIKDYDERYWAFRKPVEEVEE